MAHQPWGGFQQWNSTSSPWAGPPCPCPTAPSRPTNMNNSNGNGILGPHPAQAHHVAYTPTDIEQALYTMSLNQQDPTHYMDTGATGNMTHNSGLQDPDPYPPVQQQR
ncbi:hypothetical protein HanXRQr2_Chr09g0397581 [Helianthus annuus]|uniref:Uncharacterized protein n=1 Tax=Helianthus annuus TaxID=4232 RepID=A0A251SQI1_HELAN|nr:hypothetical protein HanXRQr2_Chr09g0397581 [Helianthus annuus]KAJ0893930.1 hypothetical protein HanPSC8_Chr09g0383331 [Helianthus annuus]